MTNGVPEKLSSLLDFTQMDKLQDFIQWVNIISIPSWSCSFWKPSDTIFCHLYILLELSQLKFLKSLFDILKYLQKWNYRHVHVDKQVHIINARHYFPTVLSRPYEGLGAFSNGRLHVLRNRGLAVIFYVFCKCMHYNRLYIAFY